jgi:hypothetical protein
MHLMQEGCSVQVILLSLVIVKELIILFFEILIFILWLITYRDIVKCSSCQGIWVYVMLFRLFVFHFCPRHIQEDNRSIYGLSNA